MHKKSVHKRFDYVERTFRPDIWLDSLTTLSSQNYWVGYWIQKNEGSPGCLGTTIRASSDFSVFLPTRKNHTVRIVMVRTSQFALCHDGVILTLSYDLECMLVHMEAKVIGNMLNRFLGTYAPDFMCRTWHFTNILVWPWVWPWPYGGQGHRKYAQ